MKKDGLVLVNMEEMASRWQIPVERIIYFITDCGMDPAQPEKWFVQNSDLILAESQKAFEDLLFPRHLRPEFPEPAA